MGKELVISSNRHETKVAVLEDDQLVEIYFQRSNEYSLAGSIHKGRVTRVLPGMQSAFVDIGLERDAFLYVTDFFEEHEEYDRISSGGEERSAAPRRQEREEPVPVGVPDGPADAVAAPYAEAGVVAAPPAERASDNDSRDQRGRRSRRRRNRGRGFPDSKYAPGGTPAWSRPAEEAPAEQVVEPEPVPEPEENGEFSVLPGESLAKYTRVEEEPQEPEETAAPAAEVEIPQVQEPEVVEEPLPVPIVVEEPPLQPAWEEPAGIEEAEPEAGMVSEETPAEAAIESEAEPDEVEIEEEISAELEAQETVPAEGSETEPAAEVLSANVLEQGGRYLHRVSKRGRRRMRPAGPGENRERPNRRSAPAQTPRTVQETAPDKGDRPPQPSITDLLREGQEILVQIAKEPLGQKGARITSHIALPGRYVVYMPTLDHLGVSRKVASDEERARLRRILQTHGAGVPGGFIVRTAGEGKSESEIAADMNFLFNLWVDIRQKAEKRRAPLLLHHDLDVVERILRDQMADGFKNIWMDNEELYESTLHFVQRFQPGLVGKVKLWTRPTPVFDAYNITAELEKALRPKVWLKSGGYIVINQTEALVAIDVNTGKFVGRSNRLEDTIVKTNTEAIKEIVRQIRLRDLGGIIVVDFIDMDERRNRQKVMQALEEAIRADRAPNKILQFNDFGLVAITRKRVKQSLERTLCSPCPHCEGAGYVKSSQTVIGEILQEAHKIAAAVEGKEVLLRVHPEVAKMLKSTGNTFLEELEEILKRPVLVTGDPVLHPEKFDLA